jgi:polyhydroxyalkanoate synthesis repressor PhaR
MAKQRIIKRYQNRKLYDTEASVYVTLDDIAQMVKAGEDVKVVDNKTQKDLTSLTLTQIVFEEEKKQQSILPLTALRRIIASSGESIGEFIERHIVPGLNSFSQARREMERYVNKLISRGKLDPEEGKSMLAELVAGSQKGLEDGYARIDAKFAEVLDALKSLGTLHRDLARLEKRVEELEAKQPRRKRAARRSAATRE